METAFLPTLSSLPQPTEDEKFAAFKSVQMEYARNGCTTIQDGATHHGDYLTLKNAAEKKLLFLDLVTLPIITDLKAFDTVDFKDTRYHHRLKVGGIKHLGDGSPQGKTAFWTKPLLTPGLGGEKEWRGEATFPYETFAGMVKAAYDTGAHSHPLQRRRVN